jgi:hypothetical protein
LRDSLNETSGSCTSDYSLDAPSGTRTEDTQTDAAATASAACTGTEAEDAVVGVEASILGLVGGDETLSLIKDSLFQISLHIPDVCKLAFQTL